MSRGLFKTESWATVWSEASFGNGLELLWGFYIVCQVWFSLKGKRNWVVGVNLPLAVISENGWSTLSEKWTRNPHYKLLSDMHRAEISPGITAPVYVRGDFVMLLLPGYWNFATADGWSIPTTVCNLSTRQTPTQTGEKGYFYSTEMTSSAELPRVTACVHRLSTLRFK